MGDTWDDEDFEPQPVAAAAAAGVVLAAVANKWEGEDEEEEVKECWDDEEEEKKDEEKKEEKVAPPPNAPKSKNKRLAEKLAEKEKASLLESEHDILDGVGLTKEEILRRRKLQEETDLKVALETLGVTDTAISLDSFNPSTKQEFDDFQIALIEKISAFRDKEEFPDFVSGLVKNICLHLNSYVLKTLKGNVENLYMEKQKLEKGDKAKKPGKGKGKAKLTVESNISQMTKYGFENDFDNEYDDFM
ncbi:eukaryotic translation initiation factor 3 subunit j isoform X2 [Arctopsyche grandis]|uniref:eukaryotic translation initiation factor 3 subunit j isoform X2 n=1 Tax=Arctopsyche grandis TaxID=121162 RepID=UPI00406D7CD1